MSKQPLPLVDATRQEFGFCRTQCACLECTADCRRIPGYLVPADLERIHRCMTPDQDLLAWARKHLLASPGAIVAYRGQAFRIHTLVPARRRDGACVFLTSNKQCAIHDVSPFGCAFFDSHMGHAEADRRSQRCLQAVVEVWETGGMYAQVWLALSRDGLVALPPEVIRQQGRQVGGDEAPGVAPDQDSGPV
jgi:Fe-S-cluster containining protein